MRKWCSLSWFVSTMCLQGTAYMVNFQLIISFNSARLNVMPVLYISFMTSIRERIQLDLKPYVCPLCIYLCYPRNYTSHYC